MSDPDSGSPNRDAVVQSLRDLAREADASGDDDRTRLLLDARWLLRSDLEGGSDPFTKELEFRHRVRMDLIRQVMAALLVLILFGVILAGVLKGLAGDQVAQFAAPVSGLAGIAVGWLFASRERSE